MLYILFSCLVFILLKRVRERSVGWDTFYLVSSESLISLLYNENGTSLYLWKALNKFVL